MGERLQEKLHNMPLASFTAESSHAFEELWCQSNCVDAPRHNVDLRRVRLVREGAHEEPVTARLEHSEDKAADAVGGGGSVGRLRTVARRGCQNRIVG